MNITPIVPMASVEPVIKLNSIAAAPQKEEVRDKISFMDMLAGMIKNVNETDAQTKVDSYNLAMGNTDMQDLHNIEINAIKADLALRTLTSVRNRVLDAYTEIMRITV